MVHLLEYLLDIPSVAQRSFVHMRLGWGVGLVRILVVLASLLLRGVDGLNMYVYVRNNPVNGVDELGYSTEVIEEDTPPVKKKERGNSEKEEKSGGFVKSSDKEVIEKHKAYTQRLITKYDEEIKNLEDIQNSKKSSKRKKAKATKELTYYKAAKLELENALLEIEIISNSDQEYRLRTEGVKRGGGKLTYKPDSEVANGSVGMIYINYDGSVESLAHELKHAHQYEEKKISFVGDQDDLNIEWGGGLLYDKQDEVEAFKRQFAYNKESVNYYDKGAIARTFEDIHVVFVTKAGYSHIAELEGGVDSETNSVDAYKAHGVIITKDKDWYVEKTIYEVIEYQNKRKPEGMIFEKVKL